MMQNKVANVVIVASIINTVIDMSWKIALTALCVYIITTDVVY